MCWKPLNTYLKLIETKFPIKNGRNIPQLNIAMASAILNPGHDENAKPEAAPTTLPLGCLEHSSGFVVYSIYKSPEEANYQNNM